MKKMVLLLAVLLPLAFASCAEEENFPLNGTVWVSSDNSTEFNFDKTKFTVYYGTDSRFVKYISTSGNRYEHYRKGTYKYISPNIVLNFMYNEVGTISESSEDCVINGNEFKLGDIIFTQNN